MSFEIYLISYIVSSLHIFFRIIYFIIIIDVLYSIFILPAKRGKITKFYVFLKRITLPLYKQVRKFIPPLWGIDFSPLILIILIDLLESFIDLFLSNIL